MLYRSCPRDAVRLAVPANIPFPTKGTPSYNRATARTALGMTPTSGKLSRHRAVLAKRRYTVVGTLPVFPPGVPAACDWATAGTYTFFWFSTYGLITARGAPPTVETK